MKFQILSRQGAEDYFRRTLNHDCAVISITDPGSEPVRFPQNERVKGILRLSFGDTDMEPNAISEENADRIAAFVARRRYDVQEIVVHCEAGLSRSAGVCAALMLWLNGSDKDIFDDPYYHPNIYCYRMTLNRIEALNGGLIGGFECIQERPSHVAEAERLFAQGLGTNEVRKELDIDDAEFHTVTEYFRYCELCHCAAFKDGVELPPLPELSYEEFKEKQSLGTLYPWKEVL